jgi:phosphoserine phosphatase RsbU/P
MSAELSLSPDVMALSTLACPIRTDDHSIDALYVVLPPEFGTGEWLALASLACKQWEQAEIAIRARHQQALHQAIERELDQARQIQTRLVPSKLKIPHVDAAIGFKPCKWVGGDYVDVLTTADGRTLLVLADVCGKGLPAALVASALHTTIRVGVRSGMPLDQLMRHLNEYLCEGEKQVAFVTAVAVLLDPRTGYLQCVNAGHPPALLFDPDGKISPLQTAANLPLGITTEALEVQESLMPAGHTLALYSDGLTDLQSEDGHRLGTELLYEKLTGLVREHPGPLAPVAERLTQLLDKTQGNTLPADDRTFLLARRLDA